MRVAHPCLWSIFFFELIVFHQTGVAFFPTYGGVLRSTFCSWMQVVAAQQIGAAQQQLLLNPGLMPADWQAAAAAAPAYQNGFDARATNPADLTGYPSTMPRVGSAADLSNISLVDFSSCLLCFPGFSTGVSVVATNLPLIMLAKWFRIQGRAVYCAMSKVV